MRNAAHLILAAPFFAAMLASSGCSTVEPAQVETGALSGSLGVLHVERSVGERSVGERSAMGGSGRTVLRAAFARYQGIDGDSVVRLLGSGSAAELGTCALVDSVDTLGVENADVELLDVGALHVAVADTEARLSPRTFPDLASVLAGVFYAGDAALAMPEPEVDEYELVAEGGVEVGAFDVVVPAPAAVGGVELLGADGTSALLDGSLTEIGRSGALTVQWDGEDPRDLVEIELVSGTETLVCLAPDEGSFRIPAADLALLDADPDARLFVRRIRLAPFDAPGIDVAVARIAALRSFPLTIR